MPTLLKRGMPPAARLLATSSSARKKKGGKTYCMHKICAIDCTFSRVQLRKVGLILVFLRGDVQAE
jgi:hypothetical protein